MDASRQKIFSGIGIASYLGILMITAQTILKGLRKKTAIIKPTGRHENETYCVLSLVIIKLMIIYLIVYTIFLTIQIIKLSLGDHYNKYYMTENQRTCDQGHYSDDWSDNVNWFVMIEFFIDTVCQTIQSLIILC